VITPLVLSDRPDTAILVNRGYVPHTHYSPTTRRESQVEGEVELVGLLRTNELTNTFTLKNKPPFEWHNRNVDELANALGTQPIFLDQLEKNRSIMNKSLPVPNQTTVNLRNEHMSYIVTWFSLSAITCVLWWQRFAKILF
jgi:surfeit locus 1 family protein